MSTENTPARVIERMIELQAAHAEAKAQLDHAINLEKGMMEQLNSAQQYVSNMLCSMIDTAPKGSYWATKSQTKPNDQ